MNEETYFTIDSYPDRVALLVVGHFFLVAHQSLLPFALGSHGENPARLGLHHLHHWLVLIQATNPDLLLGLLKLMWIRLRHGSMNHWPVEGSTGVHRRHVLALRRKLLHRSQLFRWPLCEAHHALVGVDLRGHVCETRIELGWKRTCHGRKAHLVCSCALGDALLDGTRSWMYATHVAVE